MKSLVFKKFDANTYWRIAFTICLAFATTLLPDMAAAGFDKALCNVLGFVNGTPAKVLGTLAIVFLGVGAFFGKVNWGTALLVAIGIAAIYGAGTIVTKISQGVIGAGAVSAC